MSDEWWVEQDSETELREGLARDMARVTEPDGRTRILPYHRNCWRQVCGRATTNAVPMYRDWADNVETEKP